VADKTAIAWATSTWNPVWGCVKLESPSPAGSACRDCYASAFAHRLRKVDPHGLDLWHPRAERQIASEAVWAKPAVWNRRAELTGEPWRVFLGSMFDWADLRIPRHVHERMWATVRACTSLKFLMLSKRPQNFSRLLPPDWGDGWAHVMLGCTTENGFEAERRLAILTDTPSAGGRFISAEPLLERIDVARYLGPDRVSWVIAGGESGPRARPTRIEWARDLRDQTLTAGAAFFLKQAGTKAAAAGWPGRITGAGHTPAEWPEDLRLQQFG
jgi:protein gp37